MIEKTIYIAEDGTEFKTKEECEVYESKNKLLMWESNGESTNDVKKAIYLYISNENVSEIFLKLCQFQYGSSELYNGIKEGDYGFFIWNDFEEYYNWVNPKTVKLLWELMHKVCPEEFEEEE